jgi:phosphoribosylaminoimidazolecarboxamide formyltransferase/IMP cyclohydrolase
MIENIDIGGPAMVRSAAKNHAYVTVVVDPSDYPAILDGHPLPLAACHIEMRQRLAAKAYARTAAYDSAHLHAGSPRRSNYPEIPYRSFAGTLREVMRYGENPHQWAGFYANGDSRAGRCHGAAGAG